MLLSYMLVVVETPRGSLSKFAFKNGIFEVEYRTPFPSFFNYGFVKNTRGADGMPEDAIVLGKTLKQGSEVEVQEVGTVYFIDDGLVDDKMITSLDGRVTFMDRVMITVFFTAYMVFKTVHYYIEEDRVVRCRYHGFSLKAGI
ncbi:MAG: hypothetical protein GF416_05675 [Candidatus Altiarchaeales archaeon]|nr:hypothetical protein [Candidatus Altiarchaeales archaeon]MBD3416604.1 hypothetical protein [Candidatus Altiarchaeales archaeon]